MLRIFDYPIDSLAQGLTIKDFLTRKGYSASILTHLKRTPQGILKNGIWAYVNDVLREGDLLTIRLIENESSPHITPVNLSFDIVYEDQDILVVNKPAGMAIHPSINHHEDSLANAVMHYYHAQGIPYVYRCVNRLDRDTTGLTVLAKNMLSSANLSRSMKQRKIHREYLAVVNGVTEKSGTIDAPIGRAEGSTIKRKIDFVGGERAVTHYQRLFHNDSHSLLLLHLDTGRTHQIRVHMNYIGHPLPGDFVYFPDFSTIKRQALHSYRLTFPHPVTAEQMDFTCPLPQDMLQFFSTSRLI